MNSEKWPCSPWVLVAQWIERPPGFREVMGSIRVGDSDFSLSHARVMQINSPFTFTTEHKIHHLYSLITRANVSLGYPNTEKRVEYTTRSGVMVKFEETPSRVFDISSQSKQKLRSKRRSKIVKIYAFKTGYPNVLHCCDFLCLNFMNY